MLLLHRLRFPVFFAAVMLLGFRAFATVATADVPSATIFNWLTDLTPILLPLCAVAAAKLRDWTPTDGFWHSKWGHALLTISGFVLMGMVDWLGKGSLSWRTLILAIGGAMSAWGGAYKPAGKPAPGVLPILPLLLLSVLSSAARADVPQFSTGPSAQFLRVGWKPRDANRLDLGNTSGIDLMSAGIGWDFAWNPPKLVRGDVCWLSLSATVMASLSGLPTQGGMDVMGSIGTYNNLFSFGVGTTLFRAFDQPNRPTEGLLVGAAGGIRNLFFGVKVAINILFAPTSKLSPSKTRLGAPPPPNFWRLGM